MQGSAVSDLWLAAAALVASLLGLPYAVGLLILSVELVATDHRLATFGLVLLIVLAVPSVPFVWYAVFRAVIGIPERRADRDARDEVGWARAEEPPLRSWAPPEPPPAVDAAAAATALATVKVAFAKRFHPDTQGAGRRITRAEVFTEFWPELERIEKEQARG